MDAEVPLSEQNGWKNWKRICMYVCIFISQTWIQNLYNYTMLMKIIKCGRNIYPVQ